MQRLVKKIGQPITATSANISGQPDSYAMDDLKELIYRANDFNLNILVLDGGQLTKGKKSTIVDLTKTPPEIIRQGSGKFQLE